MAQPVKYKKPRRINAVSVTLVALMVGLGVVGWEYAPLYITKQEAYRVLESYGSTFAGRDKHYTVDNNAREALRNKMNLELRQVGVDDMEESWIEVDGREVVLGVKYYKVIEWPFDLIERSEEEYVVEHTLIVD